MTCPETAHVARGPWVCRVLQAEPVTLSFGMACDSVIRHGVRFCHSAWRVILSFGMACDSVILSEAKNLAVSQDADHDRGKTPRSG
jgi:hypothetical protein